LTGEVEDIASEAGLQVRDGQHGKHHDLDARVYVVASFQNEFDPAVRP